MRRLTSLRRRTQAGQAMAELALVMPLLGLALFSFVEIGQAAGVKQILNTAARQGARYAALPVAGSSTLPASSTVTNYINTLLTNAGLTATQATVTVNQSVTIPSGDIEPTGSQVDITYTYTFLTPMLAKIVPNLTLGGHAMMRNETN